MSIRHQTTHGGKDTRRILLAAAVAASAIIASAAGGTGIETEIVGERDSVALGDVPLLWFPSPSRTAAPF